VPGGKKKELVRLFERGSELCEVEAIVELGDQLGVVLVDNVDGVLNADTDVQQAVEVAGIVGGLGFLTEVIMTVFKSLDDVLKFGEFVSHGDTL
jgi:hypothetical protein